MKRILMLAIPATLSVVAIAETETVTCYLTTSATMSGHCCASTNAAYWAIGSENGTPLGECGDPLPDAYDYVVRGGKCFIMENDAVSFPSQSVRLGDRSVNPPQYGYYNSVQKGKEAFFGQELILERGAVRVRAAGSHTIKADKITVRSPENDVFQFLFRYNAQTLTLKGAVWGDEGTGVEVGGSCDATRSNTALRGTYAFANDWSNFKGTLSVTSLYARVSDTSYGTRVQFGEHPPSGTVLLYAESTAEFTSPSPVAMSRLVLNDNSLLVLKTRLVADGEGNYWTNAHLNITGNLTVNGKTHIKMSGWNPEGNEYKAGRMILLTVPSAENLDENDFELDADATFGRIKVVNNQDGTKSLVLDYDQVVRQKVSDYDGVGKASGGKPHTSSMSIAENWTDGETPHEGAHYFVAPYGSVKEMCLRTPHQTDGADDDKIDTQFLGNSLTIGGGCRLTIFGAHFRVPLIRMLDGSDIQTGAGSKPTVHADISVSGGRVYLSAYSNKELKIDGRLKGSGNVCIACIDEATSAVGGGVSFNFQNPDFLGTMEVFMREGKTATDSAYQKLFVKDELNLGGKLESFNPTALTVHGSRTRLIARADVSFTTNYNRGIYFYDNPFIDTGIYTMKVTTAIGVNGKLTKEGTGTLELGGKLSFANALDTMPTDGSNTFAVTAGNLAVSGVDAVNGLELLFSEGTKLVLKANPEDEELMRWGIRNVKADTPFALADGLGKLPISLDLSAGEIPPTSRLGLLTVKNDPAIVAAVREMMPTLPRVCKGFLNCPVEIVDEESDTCTFALEFKENGLKLVIR